MSNKAICVAFERIFTHGVRRLTPSDHRATLLWMGEDNTAVAFFAKLLDWLREPTWANPATRSEALEVVFDFTDKFVHFAEILLSGLLSIAMRERNLDEHTVLLNLWLALTCDYVEADGRMLFDSKVILIDGDGLDFALAIVLAALNRENLRRCMPLVAATPRLQQLHDSDEIESVWLAGSKNLRKREEGNGILQLYSLLRRLSNPHAAPCRPARGRVALRAVRPRLDAGGRAECAARHPRAAADRGRSELADRGETAAARKRRHGREAALLGARRAGDGALACGRQSRGRTHSRRGAACV
jgi:hypothetical protein